MCRPLRYSLSHRVTIRATALLERFNKRVMILTNNKIFTQIRPYITIRSRADNDHDRGFGFAEY